MITIRAGEPESKDIRVWLDGEEKTDVTFYAELPDNPGEECDGELGMYVRDSEGRIVTAQRDGGDVELVKVWKTGMVRWERIAAGH